MNESLKKPRSCLLLVVLFAIGTILLLFLAYFSIVKFDWQTSLKKALFSRVQIPLEFRADFLKKFQFVPSISTDTKVELEGVYQIAEFANAEGVIKAKRNYTHQFLGSTKHLELEGSFDAKAGFKLSRNFHVHIDNKKSLIHVDLPSPELLSLTPKEITFSKDEDGWWNEITPEERNENMELFLKEAAMSPELKPVLLAARENMVQLLQAFFGKFYPDYTVRFSFKRKLREEAETINLKP
ncbi:MAG: DUF4230 domain-containing protein [Chthoniobacterales bacterium]